MKLNLSVKDISVRVAASLSDDLSDKILALHHQPLRLGILCLDFMGLNLSSEQIAQEFDLDQDDGSQMTSQWRTGMIAGKPEVILSQEVECDEVDVTAGAQGHPEAGKKQVVLGGETVSKGFGGGGPKRRKNHRFLG